MHIDHAYIYFLCCVNHVFSKGLVIPLRKYILVLSVRLQCWFSLLCQWWFVLKGLPIALHCWQQSICCRDCPRTVIPKSVGNHMFLHNCQFPMLWINDMFSKYWHQEGNIFVHLWWKNKSPQLAKSVRHIAQSFPLGALYSHKLYQIWDKETNQSVKSSFLQLWNILSNEDNCISRNGDIFCTKWKPLYQQNYSPLDMF